MRKKDFYNISMAGRLAYQLMCLERYLLTKYPDNNFQELMKLLWPATNGMFWDKFVGYVIELSPSYFMEFDSYEKQIWHDVSKELYDKMKPTISTLGSDIDELFELLKDQAYVFEGTGVQKPGIESINIIFETIKILKDNNIPIPDVKAVAFSTIDQFRGWGNKFDGTKLSRILTNN